MEEIEDFRMNQSRNSSFAEIIFDDGRGSLIDTKTVVDKSIANRSDRSSKTPE